MKTKEDASVKISNLVKTYTDDRGRPTFTAVKNIDLDIKNGEFMVLVGPSGCGKSTCLPYGRRVGKDFQRDDIDRRQSG